MNNNYLSYRFFRNRPLVCFAGLFLFGIVFSIIAGLADNGLLVLLPILFTVLLILIVLHLCRKSLLSWIMFLCLSFLIGILYPCLYNSAFRSDLLSLSGSRATVYGIIMSEPKLSSSGKTMTATLKTDYIKTKDKEFSGGGKIMVSIPLGSDVKYGDGIKFSARLNLPAERLGDFKYRRYLLTQGCCLYGYADSFETYEPQMSPFEKFCYLGYIIKERFCDFVDYAVMDVNLNALLKGIILGDKTDFSDRLYSQMSGSGFMHIAAVSGLHIGFLCSFMLLIFKRLPLRLRSAVPLPLLILFMSVSNFTPSVNRAAIMASFILLGSVLLRNPDTTTSLFAAGLILCLINPYIVFNVSFIMSFTATLFLVVFSRPFSQIASHFSLRISHRLVKQNNRLRTIISSALNLLFSSAAVSIASQIGITPISAYIFGRISLLSFVGNIAVVPCTMVVFTAGIICFALYLVYPPLSLPGAAVVLNPFLTIIHETADFFARFSCTLSQKPSFIIIIVYYLLCIALYRLVIKKTKGLNHPEHGFFFEN